MISTDSKAESFIPFRSCRKRLCFIADCRYVCTVCARSESIRLLARTMCSLFWNERTRDMDIGGKCLCTTSVQRWLCYGSHNNRHNTCTRVQGARKNTTTTRVMRAPRAMSRIARMLARNVRKYIRATDTNEPHKQTHTRFADNRIEEAP